MAKPLEVSVIEKNISALLQTSRDILFQVRRLDDIAELESNPQLKADLESVMHRLLEISDSLADTADETGTRVLENVRS
jgi:hypothetical protein